MNTTVTATITGIDEDMASLKKEFESAMAEAMNNLKADMADCLEEHVQSDVYDAFSPHEYRRRGKIGGLSDIEGSSFFDVRRNGVRMLYLPSGESQQVEHPLHGDALIGRIEKKQPEYDWSRKPGKRPFFTKFVTEMVEDGRAERTLVNAMNLFVKDIVITADGMSTYADEGEIYE